MNLKKRIIKLKWFPAAVFNKTIFRLRHIEHGKHLTTFGTIFVRGTGLIKIGSDVTITSCRETNPIGGDIKTILYAKKNGSIEIGDHTGISNCSIVSSIGITIGDHVLIGGSCKLYDHDFHSLDFEKRMSTDDQGGKAAPIKIESGAFIGAHSIILKGVTIGEKSIIGAGSVVTKDIPAGEIWAGNPAKFIRRIDGQEGIE